MRCRPGRGCSAWGFASPPRGGIGTWGSPGAAAPASGSRFKTGFAGSAARSPPKIDGGFACDPSSGRRCRSRGTCSKPRRPGPAAAPGGSRRRDPVKKAGRVGGADHAWNLSPRCMRWVHRAGRRWPPIAQAWQSSLEMRGSSRRRAAAPSNCGRVHNALCSPPETFRGNPMRWEQSSGMPPARNLSALMMMRPEAGRTRRPAAACGGRDEKRRVRLRHAEPANSAPGIA